MMGQEPRIHTPSLEAVHRYHDGTKHHFQNFARSLGYLDWASQPRPFRAFAGADLFPLYPSVSTGQYAPLPTTYGQLFSSQVAAEPPAEPSAEPMSAAAVGDILRHALGLSAWKQYGTSRWSLRVNPSSGNLHPTEAYIVCGAIPGLAGTPAVYHYAADRHALERRCAFSQEVWAAACAGRGDVLLVALTSIHWREAWKYGERAFRYCQHDLGHAIAAVGFASALVGWRATMLPAWSHASIATLTGIDRGEDFTEAEREEPGCLLAITATGGVDPIQHAARLVEAIREGQWSGHASQLSEEHVEWTFIDEIARATEAPAMAPSTITAEPTEHAENLDLGSPGDSAAPLRTKTAERAEDLDLGARQIILQRRSAVSLDGMSSIDAPAFFEMLWRTMPGAHAPWDALWWTPRIHLAIFVHRVNGVAPGLYLLGRDREALGRLKEACGREFLWEAAHDELPFMLLARGECRALAARLSCDQTIAADGFFSLGMIAEFDAALETFGPWFYRQLFWESGVVGQTLYLEAEAAGARATGIGCFYDDPVHDVLGLQGHAFQSLYHFTVGMPVEDARLMTQPGYEWEAPRSTNEITETSE